jgi:hypothetical protein
MPISSNFCIVMAYDQKLLNYRDVTRRMETAERWRDEGEQMIGFGFIYGYLLQEMAETQLSPIL